MEVDNEGERLIEDFTYLLLHGQEEENNLISNVVEIKRPRV